MINLIASAGQQHIEERIREGLEQTTVRSGLFVDASALRHFDTVDAALPRVPREELAAYVGERPAATFIYDQLSQRLGRKFRYQAGSENVPLVSLDGFTEPAELAAELFASLISLPWKYKLIVPLPDAIGKCLLDTLGQTTFVPGVSLIPMSESLAPMPTSKGLAAMALGSATTKKEGAALELEVHGFMGGYGQTLPAETAVNLIDSFLGICLASRIFHYGFVHFMHPPARAVHVHREILGDYVYESTFDLSRVQAEGMVSVHMEPSLHDSGPVLQEHLIKKLSATLTQFFADGDDASRIRTAAKWLFNSHTTNDPMLSFVQATIVLEILLGEEKSNEKVGLSALLRDRCAYLIGSSPEERRNVKKQFDDIYEIRSNIVHAGKHKLTLHENRYLHVARSLGARIIAKELDLLGASSR